MQTAELHLPFIDRKDAGMQLASQLAAWKSYPAAVVLALPRGGVPVAWEVAQALALPLDILVVRKIGFPGSRELAAGAIASGGATVFNPEIAALLPRPTEQLAAVIAHEKIELERREALYRGDRPPLDLKEKTVILIDDGLATGATMRAAVQAVRKLGAARCIAAAPVGSSSACESLRQDADEVVCAHLPLHFQSVGRYYQDFSQTTDAEVRELLSTRPALVTADPQRPLNPSTPDTSRGQAAARDR
jgi:predicted phosphoribosyltransferase